MGAACVVSPADIFECEQACPLQAGFDALFWITAHCKTLPPGAAAGSSGRLCQLPGFFQVLQSSGTRA